MSAINTLAHALEIYNEFGFIKSGHAPYGHKDNRERIFEKINENEVPSDESIKKAEEMKDDMLQDILFRRLADKMTSFDKTVTDALNSDKDSNFNVAVLASLPKVWRVMKKQKERQELNAKLKVLSEYQGTIGQREEFDVEIISSRWIRSMDTNVIQAIDVDDNLFSFWSTKDDYEVGKKFKLRGTVKKHIVNTYSDDVKETQLGRVTIVK